MRSKIAATRVTQSLLKNLEICYNGCQCSLAFAPNQLAPHAVREQLPQPRLPPNLIHPLMPTKKAAAAAMYATAAIQRCIAAAAA